MATTPTTGQTAPAAGAQAVRRRHVIYLAGFDPKGPAQYHGLYQREAALQAPVGGYRIEVGPRQREGAHGSAWDVRWRAGRQDPANGREEFAGNAAGEVAGQRARQADAAAAETVTGDPGPAEVDTRYESLRWDDLVRQHWPVGRWAALRLTVRNSWELTRNGCFWRFLHISWPAVLALALPGLLLLGVGVAVLLLLAAVVGLTIHGHGVVAGIGTLAVGAALYRGTLWAQDKMYMGWLMRSTRVILHQARGELPELETRLDRFAERVVELSREPGVDELLVVGHSSGAMLAASVMARALRRDPMLASRTPAVALLTLGHCMPLLSCQPEADGFRSELRSLRYRGRLPWVDFTAPADGCCSALTDPTALHVTASQVADESARGAAGGPKLLSPRFNKLFSSARYAEVRRDKYRCHFQYLMATELAGDYDYFAITAGPLTLAERFERHASITNFRDFQLFGGPQP